MYLNSAICMALIIGVASGLRNCPDDCIDVGNCQQALYLAKNNKSKAVIDMITRAHCGSRKICCSDFDNGFENHPSTNLLPAECGVSLQDRVFNGENTGLYEIPWIVLISYGTASFPNFMCSGSLINSRYVLTAAHCIKGKEISFVRVGEYDMNDEKYCCKHEDETCECYVQDINVSDTHIFPSYSATPVRQNDIALLRLEKHVDLTMDNVGTICLPIYYIPDNKLYGTFATISGWGASNKNEKSNVLKKALVPILSPKTCKEYYRQDDDALEFKAQWQTKLCAGGNNRDACNGDSGGPLMFEDRYMSSNKFIQLGIVSYGAKDCVSKPGVYTDVRKYIKWILDTIRP